MERHRRDRPLVLNIPLRLGNNILNRRSVRRLSSVGDGRNLPMAICPNLPKEVVSTMVIGAKTSDPKASSEAETTAVATARAAAIGKSLSLKTGELNDNESPVFERVERRQRCLAPRRMKILRLGAKMEIQQVQAQIPKSRGNQETQKS